MAADIGNGRTQQSPGDIACELDEVVVYGIGCERCWLTIVSLSVTAHGVAATGCQGFATSGLICVTRLDRRDGRVRDLH